MRNTKQKSWHWICSCTFVWKLKLSFLGSQRANCKLIEVNYVTVKWNEVRCCHRRVLCQLCYQHKQIIELPIRLFKPMSNSGNLSINAVNAMNKSLKTKKRLQLFTPIFIFISAVDKNLQLAFKLLTDGDVRARLWTAAASEIPPTNCFWQKFHLRCILI